MANDAYCCDDGEQELAELNEQEYQLYLHELQTLGVKNEHSDNDTRGKRNREINQPTQSQSKRCIADSGSKEAPPF